MYIVLTVYSAPPHQSKKARGNTVRRHPRVHTWSNTFLSIDIDPPRSQYSTIRHTTAHSCWHLLHFFNSKALADVRLAPSLLASVGGLVFFSNDFVSFRCERTKLTVGEFTFYFGHKEICCEIARRFVSRPFFTMHACLFLSRPCQLHRCRCQLVIRLFPSVVQRRAHVMTWKKKKDQLPKQTMLICFERRAGERGLSVQLQVFTCRCWNWLHCLFVLGF